MADSMLSELAFTLRQLSQRYWINRSALLMIGQHPKFLSAQKKLRQFAQLDKPVLITGETGVGKEVFARSLYLLCTRRGKPFLTINCAQYQDDNLIVSELFGHKKGSFTGATTDHRGLFDDADGGVLFLDEVGELTPKAQAMLLRALSEDEIKPLGSTRSKAINVRVIAATNRDLEEMVQQGAFREDLYYRLRYLRLKIPPLRERGEDWRLLASHYLVQLNREACMDKKISPTSFSYLADYCWPGNVREVQGVMDVGFCLSDGTWIEPQHFKDELNVSAGTSPKAAPSGPGEQIEFRCRKMIEEQESFWEVVHRPFLDRELNRAQVRTIMQVGLRQSGGSYKRLLPLYGIADHDYLKFMDFLRHHRLKPEKIEVSHYQVDYSRSYA